MHPRAPPTGLPPVELQGHQRHAVARPRFVVARPRFVVDQPRFVVMPMPSHALWLYCSRLKVLFQQGQFSIQCVN